MEVRSRSYSVASTSLVAIGSPSCNSDGSFSTAPPSIASVFTALHVPMVVLLQCIRCQRTYIMVNLTRITDVQIIGASLSEPHIDHDNVPRHGETCMWHACSVCRHNVPENTPIQSITCSPYTCSIDGITHCCTNRSWSVNLGANVLQKRKSRLCCQQETGSRCLSNSCYKIKLGWLVALTETLTLGCAENRKAMTRTQEAGMYVV